MSLSHKQVLKQLFPISLGDDGSVFDRDLTVEGAALDRAETSANSLLDQILPETCDADMLLRWCRILDLTPDASTEVNRAAVLFNLRLRGGLSVPHFIALADSLDFEIEIDDMRPFGCGVDTAGFPIWDPGIIWCWKVTVLNHELTMDDFIGKDAAAVTEGGTGYLWTWDAVGGVLEKLFNRLKPAGGVALFFYPMDGVFDVIIDHAADEDEIEDSAADEDEILDHAV